PPLPPGLSSSDEVSWVSPAPIEATGVPSKNPIFRAFSWHLYGCGPLERTLHGCSVSRWVAAELTGLRRERQVRFSAQNLAGRLRGGRSPLADSARIGLPDAVDDQLDERCGLLRCEEGGVAIAEPMG